MTVHDQPICVNTKLRVLGQVLICKGCCCGNIGSGKPPVPEAKLRSIWKAEKLNRTIQLTVSGCLGPCDIPNVVQVITDEGQEWYGRLEDDGPYDALIDWARACHKAKALLPRPHALVPHRFERFAQVPMPRKTPTNPHRLDPPPSRTCCATHALRPGQAT